MDVTLQEILQAREQRVQRQNVFLQKGLPVVCLTMNIPGPVKNSLSIQRAFLLGAKMLRNALCVAEEEILTENTGCEALFSVEGDSRDIKQICTDLEERIPLGRLWDMDVLTPSGEKLSREEPRSCLVCGKPGRLCAATRAHSVSQLQAATRQLIWAHFAPGDCASIGHAAVESLIYEVNVTPKPGLVDRRNNGSHKDMDLPLFLKSARTLEGYFTEAAAIGIHTQDRESCFQKLRQAGLAAEQAMLAATGGVNTHKGAIFTLGLLCGSIGNLWTPGQPFAGITQVLDNCKALCKTLTRDFSRTDLPQTYGKQLYASLGITGIRGEAMAGFPSIASGLQVYADNLALGENDAGVHTLLHLIARVEDTNLYHRGGTQGAEFAKTSAEQLLKNPKKEDILRLDDVFMEKNLSPGGSADLLAAIRFLHTLHTGVKMNF
ncbi:MAG: citrate lyase holo-[Oscillospiraceae bacterium]|nr:citrate lyase holo-[acyl-carrier protein] synthase [Oscillospiraceae bacterium]